MPFVIYLLCTLVLLSSLKACGIELRDVSLPHKASEAAIPKAEEIELKLEAKDLQLQCIQIESENCQIGTLVCRAAGCDGNVENIESCKEHVQTIGEEK